MYYDFLSFAFFGNFTSSYRIPRKGTVHCCIKLSKHCLCVSKPHVLSRVRTRTYQYVLTCAEVKFFVPVRTGTYEYVLPDPVQVYRVQDSKRSIRTSATIIAFQVGPASSFCSESVSGPLDRPTGPGRPGGGPGRLCRPAVTRNRAAPRCYPCLLPY